jgi:hypothetical protein
VGGADLEILRHVVGAQEDEDEVGIIGVGGGGAGGDLGDALPRPGFDLVVGHVAVGALPDHVYVVAVGDELPAEGVPVAVAVGGGETPCSGGVSG